MFHRLQKILLRKILISSILPLNYLEEAAGTDHIAIIDDGRIAASGTTGWLCKWLRFWQCCKL